MQSGLEWFSDPNQLGQHQNQIYFQETAQSQDQEIWLSAMWTKGKGKEKEEGKAKDDLKDRAQHAGPWTIGLRNALSTKEEKREAKARTEEEKERAQPHIQSKLGLLGTRTMDSEDSRVIATCVA